VLRLPAASDNGDEMTQAIRLPMGAEPTQAIRLPVAENGEKTQMLRLPVDTVPVDTVPVDTVPIDVASPASIADAERPNFAEDPTGRLLPPGPASEEPTRTMTVMNLERPPDEIPTQRRHTPDEN
jgi:hypothetical protein